MNATLKGVLCPDTSPNSVSARLQISTAFTSPSFVSSKYLLCQEPQPGKFSCCRPSIEDNSTCVSFSQSVRYDLPEPLIIMVSTTTACLFLRFFFSAIRVCFFFYLSIYHHHFSLFFRIIKILFATNNNNNK